MEKGGKLCTGPYHTVHTERETVPTWEHLNRLNQQSNQVPKVEKQIQGLLVRRARLIAVGD